MNVPRTLAAAIVLAISGCTTVPPPVAPMVAAPGPNKTQEAFGQDDAACRAEVSAAPPGAANPAPTADSPGLRYLNCMALRNNLVEPIPPPPAYYAYYPSYPLYPPFAYYDPIFVGGFVRFGGYHGFHGGYYHR